MGYAGGTKENPTYRDLGNHTETLQVDYDPNQITYEELLDIFWDSHHPIDEPWSRQYMSIIFYHNEEQRVLAEASKEEREKVSSKLYTEIRPIDHFYRAENYHQKYYLQSIKDLFKDSRSNYDSFKDFVDATAPAHINGYIKGYGTMALLEEEIDTLGLSEQGEKRLRQIVEGYGR